MKKLTLIAAALLGVLGAQAETLTPEAALQRALGCDGSERMAPSRQQYELVSSVADCYYVFNRSDRPGFVIASGDDRLRPTLAYSDQSTFDGDNLPPALQWWMEQQEQEIKAFLANPLTVEEPEIVQYYKEWTPIEPIVKTQWNQGSPYNNDCPTVNGSKCVTGCVATAMAQILYTNKYFKGTGTKSYSDNGTTRSYNFGTAKIDFSAMTPTYSASSSAAANAAVANLMYACGVIAEMNYAPSGSGAQASIVPANLVEYFGYDATYTGCINRTQTQTARWQQIIYNELKNGRPVMYTGQANGGGHAFVCDGYDTAGAFHFNWGWGGISDGYYYLSSLNPGEQGIGSFEGGYNSYQELVLMVPPTNTAGCEDITSVLGFISFYGTTFYTYYTVEGHAGAIDIKKGLCALNSDGDMATNLDWGSLSISSREFSYTSGSANFKALKLPAGKYKVAPSYSLDNGATWVAVKPYVPYPWYIEMTVDASGNCTFKEIGASTPMMHVVDLDTNGPLYANDKCPVTFTLVNTSTQDFNSTFYVALYKGNATEPSVTCEVAPPVCVAAGDCRSVSTSLTLEDDKNNKLAAGTYTVKFLDARMSSMSDDTFTVEVKSGSAPSSGYTLPTDFYVTNSASMPTVLLNGDIWSWKPYIVNTVSENYVDLKLGFFKQGTTTNPVVTYGLGFTGYISAGRGTAGTKEVTVDVAPGVYSVAILNSSTIISEPQTVCVGAVANDVAYMPNADGSGVKVNALTGSLYSGDVVIPATVRVSGADFAVTGVNGGAFEGCTDLTSLTLPASVTTMGMNSLRMCLGLDYVMFGSTTVPFAFEPYVGYCVPNSTEFYVPAAAYDGYATALASHPLVYAAIESLTAPADVTTSEAITATVTVAPASEHSNPNFTVEAQGDSVADVEATFTAGKLTLTINPTAEGTATYTVTSAQPGVKPVNFTVTVSGLGSITEVEAPSANEVIYDLQGRRVLAPTHGLYLINGRKVLI